MPVMDPAVVLGNHKGSKAFQTMGVESVSDSVHRKFLYVKH